MPSWCWIVAGVWALLALHDLWAVWRLPRLPALPAEAPRPDVTVVMAVRDDVQHVDATVTALLAQRHVDLRVVVVDDRSTDGTSERLAALAARDTRLCIETVRDLPDGWLGKSHALHRGASGVSTRWLLFTDGDAQLAPDALARAIAAATTAQADHVALLPTHRDTTALGRSCLLAFHLTVLRRVAAVNARRQRSFVGTGAFNLVRTEAWRAIGGHEPLRLEVVDDVWLGLLLRRAGFRSRIWFAPDALAIDWGGTPARLVRVTTKNMFAVLRYRTWLALPAVVLTTALLLTPLLAPWCCGTAGLAATGAWLAGAVPGMALAHRMRWPWRDGALVPFGRFLLPIAMLHSVWTTLRQGGVRWRGTFYALDTLRRGQVR